MFMYHTEIKVKRNFESLLHILFCNRRSTEYVILISTIITRIIRLVKSQNNAFIFKHSFAIEHLKNEYSEQKQMHDHYRHCSESYFILIKELKEQLERMVEEYPTIRGIAFRLNAIHEFERRTY